MISLLLRPILSAGWLVALAALFRFWELGGRVPGLMLWSAVFVVLYAGTLGALGREAVRRPGERRRLLSWAALVVAVLVAHAFFPLVEVRDVMVRTTAFVKVVDAVVAVWILARAMIVLWTGPARILALAGVPAAMALGFYTVVIAMPGRSLTGELPPLSPAESTLAGELERDVRFLSSGLGERNFRRREALDAAARYVDSALAAAGYEVVSLPFTADGLSFRNIEVTLPGASDPSETVVIGAHYDTAEETPGANDNASGTAALLALARELAGRRFERTVRIVAFPNEEPPYFAGPFMGSHVYAAEARRRGDRIVAMLSLETVGAFTDEPGSQLYPPPFSFFYPDRGNFIGFVGNIASRSLVRRAVGSFREHGTLPSEGAAAPALVRGVSWSDHQSFWRYGYAAIMITDTAPFRYPHYHTATDTADRLDYGRMARVVTGLVAVVGDLAGG